MACSPVLNPPSSTNSPPSQLPFPLPPLPSEAIQESHFPSQHLRFHYPSHPNVSAQSQTRTSRTTILLLFSHPITTLPPTLQRNKIPIYLVRPTNQSRIKTRRTRVSHERLVPQHTRSRYVFPTHQDGYPGVEVGLVGGAIRCWG